MTHDFSYFELGIDRVSLRLPGMPRDRVVINRLFFFVFRELDGRYNRLLADYGLNTTTFLALAMLYGSKQINPSDLSDALVSSRTNVTRLADEMVAAGWVGRQASTEDRRRVDLALTDSGHALIEQVLPAVWDLVGEQWADFSASEITEFDRLLRKLLSGLNGQ